MTVDHLSWRSLGKTAQRFGKAKDGNFTLWLSRIFGEKIVCETRPRPLSASTKPERCSCPGSTCAPSVVFPRPRGKGRRPQCAKQCDDGTASPLRNAGRVPPRPGRASSPNSEMGRCGRQDRRFLSAHQVVRSPQNLVGPGGVDFHFGAGELMLNPHPLVITSFGGRQQNTSWRKRGAAATFQP